MQTIRRPRRPVDQAKFQVAKLEHADLTVSETSLLYVDDETEPSAYFHVLNTFPSDLIDAFKATHYQRTARTDGLVTESRTLGYLPRVTLRRDFCTATSLSREQPKEHDVFLRYARQASQELQALVPARAAHMQKQLDQVLPEWRLPGTLYTSGIVNSNNPLRYHFDTGNFKGIWSSMYALSSGCRGGLLVIPAFGTAFSFDRPALIMFDGQALLHGVTALEKLNGQSYRYSVVFYSMQQMCHCLPLDEEVNRIRNVRVKRERKRAGVKP